MPTTQAVLVLNSSPIAPPPWSQVPSSPIVSGYALESLRCEIEEEDESGQLPVHQPSKGLDNQLLRAFEQTQDPVDVALGRDAGRMQLNSQLRKDTTERSSEVLLRSTVSRILLFYYINYIRSRVLNSKIESRENYIEAK